MRVPATLVISVLLALIAYGQLWIWPQYHVGFLYAFPLIIAINNLSARSVLGVSAVSAAEKAVAAQSPLSGTL